MAFAGYRYLMGLHMGVCKGPVDELVEIKVGGRTAWRGSVTANQSVDINAYELFGGEDGEGGIQGTLQVLMGEADQVLPTPMSFVLRSPMPGFRRRFTLFFDGIVSMLNPYPKPWAVRARRVLKGWEGEPWLPELATIDIVRPISSTEVGTSGSTSIESKVVTADITLSVATTNFSVQLVPPSTGILVGIDFGSAYEGGVPTEDSGGVRYLQAGVDYTLSTGGVFQLIGYLATVSTPFFVYLRYSYSYVTTNPPVGGGTTFGEALIRSMNPAHILYECLTNKEWGRGLPRFALDDSSWRIAAQRLSSEKFGLCIAWKRRDSVKAFMQTVLDHIGGRLYSDRRTGLIKLGLIREDYTKSSLPLFDSDSGLLSIDEAPISVPNSMINEVKIKYRDPVTGEDRTARAINLANIRASGGVVNSTTKEFIGLPTEELAARVAKRELRVLSQGLRRFNLTLDRRGYDLTPGSVFRIRDPQRGIPDTVLRAGEINYGNPKDGRIRLVAVQDVFGLPDQGFAVIGPPTGNTPNRQACVGDHKVFELPYRSIYKRSTVSEFAFVPDSAAYLGVVCQEGNGLNLSYNLAVRSGLPEPEDVPSGDDYYCGYTPS